MRLSREDVYMSPGQRCRTVTTEPLSSNGRPLSQIFRLLGGMPQYYVRKVVSLTKVKKFATFLFTERVHRIVYSILVVSVICSIFSWQLQDFLWPGLNFLNCLLQNSTIQSSNLPECRILYIQFCMHSFASYSWSQKWQIYVVIQAS
jgi:hypothetical protein